MSFEAACLYMQCCLVSLLRANLKSVFGQAAVLALAQGAIFYIYSAGYYMGAFQVTRDPTVVYHASYDQVFR